MHGPQLSRLDRQPLLPMSKSLDQRQRLQLQSRSRNPRQRRAQVSSIKPGWPIQPRTRRLPQGQWPILSARPRTRSDPRKERIRFGSRYRERRRCRTCPVRCVPMQRVARLLRQPLNPRPSLNSRRSASHLGRSRLRSKAGAPRSMPPRRVQRGCPDRRRLHQNPKLNRRPRSKVQLRRSRIRAFQLHPRLQNRNCGLPNPPPRECWLSKSKALRPTLDRQGHSLNPSGPTNRRPRPRRTIQGSHPHPR